jgi:hypothetical protein
LTGDPADHIEARILFVVLQLLSREVAFRQYRTMSTRWPVISSN